jgi:PAS domain S-box-containing protein
MPTFHNPWKIPWHLVLIFLLLSAGILVLGYSYYENEAAHFQRETEAQLNAIANLKVKQIVAWRQERMQDALSMFEDPIFAHEVLEWLDGWARPGRKDEILNRMGGVKQDLYESLRLLDPEGTVRLAIPETEQKVNPSIKKIAFDALTRHRVIFSELLLDAKNEIKLYLVVPIHFHQGGQHDGGQIINVGIVVMKLDPCLSLYPLILSWPTLSSTAEFTLLKREGDEIVYLNDLRHRTDAALSLRVSLTESRDPGVKAALGKEEITHGIDYRGAPVLAATRTIPDSPWFLVAKIDTSEVYAAIQERLRRMVFLVLALIAASGLGIAYMWRDREVQFFRQQYLSESEKRTLSQRYEYLAKHAKDIILIMDRTGKIIEANDQAEISYGYSHDELLNLHFGNLTADNLPITEDTMLEMAEKNSAGFEAIHRRKDGMTFPVEVSSSLMEIEGNRLFQCIIRDITKRKQWERMLQESEQRLRFLSSQLLIVQEQERQRISKEIHDELGQALAVTRYELSSIESRLPKKNTRLRTDWQNLLNYLESTIENVRRLSQDLSPAFLEQFGLSTAVKNLLEEFGKYLEIQWSPEEIKGIDNLFSRLKEVNIYRIFQESLNNIARHAQAARVSIRVERLDDSVRFTVHDDGKGFDFQKICRGQSKGTGIGLPSMQERARLSEGSLKIRSQPGAGTDIIFVIPIEKGGGNGAALSHPIG